jgi:hypothetical protein
MLKGSFPPFCLQSRVVSTSIDYRYKHSGFTSGFFTASCYKLAQKFRCINQQVITATTTTTTTTATTTTTTTTATTTTTSTTTTTATTTTSWSRGLLEKLTDSQLVKKFPAFYGTRRFITAFTRARHLSLSWASSIQFMPPQHVIGMYIYIYFFFKKWLGVVECIIWLHFLNFHKTTTCFKLKLWIVISSVWVSVDCTVSV